MAELTAIIGGTGLSQIEGLSFDKSNSDQSDQYESQAKSADQILPAEKPYGQPSNHIEQGWISGHPVVFLARHGNPHQLAPHKVNYRANIWALKQLGVTRIIAVTAVGSIAPELALADLVITDQIIDYTYGREHTYFDDDLNHIDFTYPNDEPLRQSLIAAAAELQSRDAAFGFADRGVYGCTQGPRLETAAEIKRMARDGCDVVGMTAMPEAALARELDIPYAGISMVVNKAAGIDGETISMDEIHAVIEISVDRIGQLLRHFARNQGS